MLVHIAPRTYEEATPAALNTTEDNPVKIVKTWA